MVPIHLQADRQKEIRDEARNAVKVKPSLSKKKSRFSFDSKSRRSSVPVLPDINRVANSVLPAGLFNFTTLCYHQCAFVLPMCHDTQKF